MHPHHADFEATLQLIRTERNHQIAASLLRLHLRETLATETRLDRIRRTVSDRLIALARQIGPTDRADEPTDGDAPIAHLAA